MSTSRCHLGDGTADEAQAAGSDRRSRCSSPAMRCRSSSACLHRLGQARPWARGHDGPASPCSPSHEERPHRAAAVQVATGLGPVMIVCRVGHRTATVPGSPRLLDEIFPRRPGKGRAAARDEGKLWSQFVARSHWGRISNTLVTRSDSLRRPRPRGLERRGNRVDFEQTPPGSSPRATISSDEPPASASSQNLPLVVDNP